MKALITGAALLVLTASSALANLACWYNEKGEYYGSDGIDDNKYPPNKVIRVGNGDYAWVYVVTTGPGTCPKSLPPH